MNDKRFKNVLKANKKIIINLIMIVLVVILTLNVVELIEVTESKTLQENNVKKQVEQYERQKLLQSTEKTTNKTKKKENTTSSKKSIKTNAIEEILKNRERTINNIKQEANITSIETEKDVNSVEQKENTTSIKKEENVTSTQNATETNTIKEAIEKENKDETVNEVKQEENVNSTENTVEANVIEEVIENESDEKTSVGYSTTVTPETMTIMGYEEIDVDKAITFIVGLIGEDNIDKINLNGTSLNFHISNTNKAAKAENVNAYFVLAQQLLETGIFTFENSSVKPEYYNFAGLGATDKDPKPNKFFSNYEGQLAQVQHLKGYATTDALNEECKDQRFSLLANKRGTATNAAELSNKWASKVEYGKLLANMYNRFHNVEVNSEIVSKYKYKEF